MPRSAPAGTPRAELDQQIPFGWFVAAAIALSLLTTSRVYLSLSLKGIEEPLADIIAGEGLSWALWLPVVPLASALDQRWGFARHRTTTAFTVHFIAALVIIVLHSLAMTLAGQAAGWYFTMDSPAATMQIQLVHEAASALLVYSAIVGVIYARRQIGENQARRIAQTGLEGQLARERLRNLQMQLHPHFLFNALHAVGGLMRDGDRDTAVNTLSDLGDLLRTSLQQSNRQFVSLHDEIEFTRAYLKIQQARHGERLGVTIDVPVETMAASIPHLLLQPLVENAIQHGTARRRDGGFIILRARCNMDRLIIDVCDDGPGPPTGGIVEGIGLSTTRERLEALYGSDFSLAIERIDTPEQLPLTRARVAIPFRTDLPHGPDE